MRQTIKVIFSQIFEDIFEDSTFMKIEDLNIIPQEIFEDLKVWRLVLEIPLWRGFTVLPSKIFLTGSSNVQIFEDLPSLGTLTKFP